MSQENVEVVRRSVAAFGPHLDRMAEFWDPAIDWRAIEGAPDDIGVFRGRDAMRRYYEQWLETFAELRPEIEELIDVGDDRVIAVLHVMARMKGSDSDVDMRLATVYSVRDGLIVRGREYATREQALQAAGLSE